MKRFAISDLRFAIWRKTILPIVLLSTAVTSPAAPLRVTTWNIEPKLAAGTNGTSSGYQKNLIKESAEILKNLNPDVILLQGVPDWESCNEMVKELKPAKYSVAAWSSFRDPQTGTLSRRQVAILSKTRAYISWSEAWKNDSAPAAPGGFAFAAIRAGGKNAGFFSIQLGDNALLDETGRSEAQQSARAESTRQLLAQIASLKNWTTNRVQSLTVAGDFNTSRDDTTLTQEKTLSLLQQSGLADAFGDLAPAKRITLPGSNLHPDATSDYIFTRNVSATAAPEIVPVALTEHYPVTCDLDLNAPPAPQPPTTPAQVAEAPTVKPTEARTNTTTNAAPTVPVTPTPQTATAAPSPAENGNVDRRRVAEIAGIAAGGILLLAIVWQVVRPRSAKPKNPALLTMKAGELTGGPAAAMPERIVIAPRPSETTGSAADHPPVVHIETPDADHVRMWQKRAEEAERRAQRATELAKRGLMRHLADWLKGRLVQRLASDRKQLIDTQNAAAQKMQIVDERLAKIENQLRSRYQAYERRITELEKELDEAREENRELIRAKIAQVRAQMEKERMAAQRADHGQS